MQKLMTGDTMPNKQPLTVVGRRRIRPSGSLRAPTAEERHWVQSMAARRTRVPKGVFKYRTMAQANADWERWHADAMVATAQTHR